MANQFGERYFCPKCGSEAIVTKASDGVLKCCGQEMQKKT